MIARTRRRYLGIAMVMVVLCVATWALIPRQRPLFLNDAVNRLGEYPLDARRSLILEETGRGILTIKWRDGGQTVLVSDINVSLYHRWRVVVDGSFNIWLKSSDIGTYVWVPDLKGGYVRKPDGPKPPFPPALLK